MSDIVKYFRKLNTMHSILALLMVIYIVFPVPIPFELATLIDTNMGSLVIIIFAIALFLLVNPVIGVLAFITGYTLLYRAGISTGSEVLRKYVPNEDQKHQEMLQLHTMQNGKTLEEEAVDNIPPSAPEENLLSEDPYQPVYSSSDIEHSEL